MNDSLPFRCKNCFKSFPYSNELKKHNLGQCKNDSIFLNNDMSYAGGVNMSTSDTQRNTNENESFSYFRDIIPKVIIYII